MPRFNFKAADIGAYSTVRYLGVLDNTVNTLRDENIWYHDIDLDKPGCEAGCPVALPVTWQRDVRIPATGKQPLACHAAVYAQHKFRRTGKTIAGDGVLNVRLQLRGGSKESGPEFFVLSDARLQDGTPVAANALTLKLNTLADRRHSGSHYWIDSGSVYLK